MKVGLFNLNTGVCAAPRTAAAVARLAEELGYDSLWAGEHVVLPTPRVAPSPLEPTDPILDPVVALAHLAAVTSRVKLGTGIIILPQRNPLVLAKELASLDVVSEGRLLFGIGVGYLEPELTAIGVPLADRGARTVEYLEAMQALWSSPAPAYHGRFVSFAGVDAYPRPVTAGGPPVVMGGHTPAAFRRAVERAQGWYGFALDADGTEACLQGLGRAGDRFGRPARLGPLEISVTPRGRLDPATVERFTRMGVDRLILAPRAGLDEATLTAYVRDHAPDRLLPG